MLLKEVLQGVQGIKGRGSLYIDIKTIPTICLYGGNDQTIGIGHYAHLKEKFDGVRNSNISLIYSRYANHDLPTIFNYTISDCIKAVNDLNDRIMNFSEKYFSKD